MRISDWSSDVCSSDLRVAGHRLAAAGDLHQQVAHADDGERRSGRLRLPARRAHGQLLAFGGGRRVRGKIVFKQSARALVRPQDRKSVVSGKRVSVRVDLGGRRIITTTTHTRKNINQKST